jgi:hypothetical protein
LAGEACGPNVSGRDFCVIEFPDVIVNRKVRPVLSENAAAERFHLTLEHHAEASPLKPEVEATDAREE